MPLVPTPIPPPPPPPVRTDARLEIEPDEQWKADLRRRIEHSLRGMVEDAQVLYDNVLNSQPSESIRESAMAQYDKSMSEIRTLAQEAFTRQLRSEMAERKWALDVVDSNSPDVARQQQWILDNIHKAEEQRLPFVPEDGTHHPASGLSSSPQQQGDGERISDGSFENRFEDGFGSARSEGEGGASDGLAESEEEEEEEEEEESDDDDDDDDDGDEVHKVDGSELRQSRSPSRPSALVHPLQSKSPVSRRGPPSRQRHPSNNPPPEYHDEEEVDLHGQPLRRRGSQPYVSSGTPARRPSSGSQGPYRRHPPPPRTTEPSGISRTLAHANGQTYSTSPIQFPRRSSINSTGSASSSAGLHRASSLNMNSEHYRSGSIASHAPGGTDRPQAHNRDRIVSVPPRERQTSALASPHDKPSPPSYPIAPRPIPGQRPPSLDDTIRFPTSASPSSRAIYGPQRSPEDVRQGIAIPRGTTTPDEGPRGASWGSSLQSRRSFGDFGAHRRHNSKGDSRLPPVDGDYSDASDDVVGQLDDRHSVYSAHSIRSMRSMELEQLAIRREAEARRKEEEATRKEEEATRKEEEAHRLEEKARQSLEEAERLEKGARQAEASAKLREAAAQKKEAEAKLKEAEAKKREAEVQKREAQAQHKEEEARLREVAARRKEEQARRKEEEVVRKEEDARKREEEVRRIEDEARKREDDARRREDDARKRERMARKMEEEARRFEDEARKMEEEVRRKEEEARRRKEEARQVEEDFERKRREIEQKEAELKKREDELSILEDAARRAQEEAARQAEETARIQAEAETARLQAEEVARQAARLQAEEVTRLQSEEAARQAEETSGLDRVAEESARQTLEPENPAPKQEKQTKGQGKKAKGQSKRQKEKELEEQRQKELEQQRLEEETRLDEERLRQEREKQIRLDEELSRQEQERLAHEAILEQERLHFEAQEREANRLREEQLRAAEEEQHRHLEEQRRKITEQGRQRDEHFRNEQFRQQQQRIKEEQQKEFERREAQYYQRTVERERQNSMGATFDSWPPHRPNSTTGSAGDRSSASSTFSSSTWSSHPPSMGSSHTTSSSFTSSSIPFSTTPKPSPPNTKPGAPGTSPYAAKFDEAEWARRAEERARQQQEQFKREQERLENERQAKTSKMLSREELIRLYENHDNKWRQLKDSDNLGWNSFAWPVFRRPSEPEEMTTSAIGAYVLSKYAPDANTKSSKDRVKDHIKRWHPDKFETRILPRVAEDEREKVKAGAGVVVRGLNELLNRNYDD